MITVVGLGNNKNEITLKGVEAIQNADCIYIKTALTETIDYFTKNNIQYISFDSIYENAENFDDLDEKVVDEILKNKQKNIVFCVNGSGFEDRSVCLLEKKKKINIVPSVSLSSLHKKASTSFVQMSAYDIISNPGFNYDTRFPLTIVDIDNKYIASELKLVLSNILGDDQDVKFNLKTIKILEIDRQRIYNYKTQINIDPIAVLEKKRFNFMDLYWIMKRLRAENGCPWDRVQTHKSIRENVIEEAYELVDAIDKEDVENMIEETGDLFMQSIFHCVIGEDCGEYNVEDAISMLCQKLIFRHPHVFGQDKAVSSDDALASWDKAKAEEKKYTNIKSKIDKVPLSFSPMMKAKKIISIMKKSNMLYLDQTTLKEEIVNMLNKLEIQEDKEKFLGALLLKIITLLELNKIDCEVALNSYLNNYVERIYKVEDKVKDKNDKQAIKKAWEEALSED